MLTSVERNAAICPKPQRPSSRTRAPSSRTVRGLASGTSVPTRIRSTQSGMRRIPCDECRADHSTREAPRRASTSRRAFRLPAGVLEPRGPRRRREAYARRCPTPPVGSSGASRLLRWWHEERCGFPAGALLTTDHRCLPLRQRQVTTGRRTPSRRTQPCSTPRVRGGPLPSPHPRPSRGRHAQLTLSTEPAAGSFLGATEQTTQPSSRLAPAIQP